jgi:hypothetical protein
MVQLCEAAGQPKNRGGPPRPTNEARAGAAAEMANGDGQPEANGRKPDRRSAARRIIDEAIGGPFDTRATSGTKVKGGGETLFAYRGDPGLVEAEEKKEKKNPKDYSKAKAKPKSQEESQEEVKAKADEVAADILEGARTMVKVLHHLQNDSRERRALLKGCGLPKDALQPRLCAAVAKGILDRLEEKPVLTIVNPNVSKERIEAEPEDGLVTCRLSQVLPAEIQWLWPQRIPRKMLTIFSGDPEVGKTWVALYVIARLTTGRAFADGTKPPGRCDCLFVTAEDPLAEVIRPRVEQLGGDPTRVHVLKGVNYTVDEWDPRTKRRTPSSRKGAALALDRHLSQLDEYLRHNPLLRFVALDPLSAFMGKVDTHKNSDVRGVLRPLAKVIEKRRVGAVGLNHLSKDDPTKQRSAMYRGMGSIAFNAQARVVWQVSFDPENADRRLFLPVKSNLGPHPPGLAFRLSPPAGVLWEKEPIALTADEALMPPKSDGAPARAEAEDWLREALRDGPVPGLALAKQAKEAGLCWSTVRAAKKKLGIRARKMGGAGSPWEWYLGDPPPH